LTDVPLDAAEIAGGVVAWAPVTRNMRFTHVPDAPMVKDGADPPAYHW
jgi:hypothetical protein